MKRILRSFSSTHIILSGFFLLIILGSFLLYLPISSSTGESVAYVDALFTATSATCVTGLVTLPTVTAWSSFGQFVILLLIQIGGLGVITVCAGIMLILSKRIGIGNRILIQDSFNLNSMSGIIKFIKKVFIGTFIVEIIGALAYMVVFVPEFGLRGIWISIFTSVSAFCNAGIDIISENSLCNYAVNPIINIVTAFLIVSGGIGFIVWWDLIRIIRDNKKKSVKFLTLHSKIALSVTIFLIVLGTALFFIFEKNNPHTIGEYSFIEKLEVSFFQSVTTRTAGFATIPQENLSNPSAILSLILMFIGGSPVGTAGGIKTVTLLVIVATALSTIKGKKTVDIFNRQISDHHIRKAIAVFSISFFVVLMSTLLLSIVSNADFLDIIYETVSATATVGLSRNLTSSFGVAGKIILIAAMYLGRVGPISIVVAFVLKRDKKNIVSNPTEEISVG